MMLVEYAKLPANPPNCYVSSAAANGHSKLVKSFYVQAKAGANGYWVNRQMQRLKFLEFALKGISPRTHGCIRVGYNLIGPMLARLCKCNRLLADLTFLMLKPLELLAVLIQKAMHVPEKAIQGIYLPEERR